MKFTNEQVAMIIRDLIANKMRFTQTAKKHDMSKQLLHAWWKRFINFTEQQTYDWSKITRIVKQA